MSKVIEYPPITLKSGSPLGEGLKKIVQRKQKKRRSSIKRKEKE